MERLVRHGWYGVLATLLAMGAGHLLAALTVPSASPVLAVGSTVIDLTPTPVKEWAIRQFGTADKAILVGSVVLVVLLLAGLAGALASHRLTLGTTALAGLAGVAAVAAATRPAAGPLDPLPSALAALVGAAALRGLTRLEPAAEEPPEPPRDRPRPPVGGTGAGGTGAGGPVGGTGAGSAGPGTGGPPRRTVLLASTAVGAAAVVTGGLGRWLATARLGGTDVALPAPAEPLPPLPTGLEERFPGISSLRTPVSQFYRVDTRLTLPAVDVEDWTLTVDGDVEREVTLDFAELTAMRVVERDITLTCVSNDVGGPYVGAARWLGVPLRDVLDRAGVDRTGADQVLSTDVDGMTISTPLSVALAEPDALLAFGMNGGPLPRAHGFPVRMVVPGLYGFVGACKWITRMTLTTYDGQQAYWTRRGWATDAPIKVSSRIDTPRPLSDNDAGRVVIGGVAWAQGVGIGRVEVRIDGGPWRRATLGPSAGEDYWRQWYYEWDAEPGQHFLACRATNRDGQVQTAVRATPFPEGSSGVQEIAVNVR